MKAVFVRPNYPTYFSTPPLGLGYLSASAKAVGIETKIIDGVRIKTPEEILIKEILAEEPDWVCITCLSAYFDEVKSIALKLRERNSNIKIAIGGVHPTFMPYMTLVETKCDYIICGEGEKSLPALLLQGNNKGIKGVYSLNELKDEDTPFEKSEIYQNLDDIPLPDWDQMQPKTYPPAPMGMIAKNYPIALMMSSRGCNFGCVFCAGGYFYDRKVRFRNPEKVVAEMKMLIEEYGVKEIQFMDDNIILRRDHIEAICNLIIKQKLKINWSCPNGIRADCLDYELARLMKKAGCYLCTMGIESSNPTVLKTIKKGEKIETISRAIQCANKAGLIITGAFILGLPGDTRETINETINYALKMPLDRALFSLLDVVPGCELWNKNKEKYKNFQKETSFAKPSIIPDNMTEQELIELQQKALRKFYFRPKTMFNVLKLMRISQLKYIIIRLLKFRLL